jgi:hypothetical protein
MSEQGNTNLVQQVYEISREEILKLCSICFQMTSNGNYRK